MHRVYRCCLGSIDHLCKEYGDIVWGVVINCDNFLEQFREIFDVIPTIMQCDALSTAPILLGKRNMSQRAYKELRTVLANKGKLPTYKMLRSFCEKTDIGQLNDIHGESSFECMGVCSEPNDTLQK